MSDSPAIQEVIDLRAQLAQRDAEITRLKAALEKTVIDWIAKRDAMAVYYEKFYESVMLLADDGIHDATLILQAMTNMGRLPQ